MRCTYMRIYMHIETPWPQQTASPPGFSSTQIIAKRRGAGGCYLADFGTVRQRHYQAGGGCRRASYKELSSRAASLCP